MGSNVIAASGKGGNKPRVSLFRVASEPFRPVHWRANSLTGSWRFSSPDVSDVAAHQPRTNRFYRATR